MRTSTLLGFQPVVAPGGAADRILLNSFARFGWVAFATALLAIGFAGTAMAGGLGDCPLTGHKDTYHIVPVIPGQLTVETVLPEPGWYNGDTPATIKDGFGYCMAANIAYRTDLDKVVVVDTTFPGLIAGRTRHFDLAIYSTTITKPREKVVAFSVPYETVHTGVAMEKTEVAKLTKEGVKIDGQFVKTKVRLGVPEGSTESAFVTNVVKPTRPIRVYRSMPAMMTALAAGQIDAAIADTTTLMIYASKAHDTVDIVGRYGSSTGVLRYGAVYPKGSPNEATFNKIIESMKKDGTLHELRDKYLIPIFGQDPAKIPFLTP